MTSSTTLIAVAVSELVAVLLIWRLVISDEHPFFKVALGLLALVPFIGPLVVLWIGGFPSVHPRALQDRYRYSTDVLDRWRGVLEEKNPHARFRKWKDVVKEDDDR